MRIWNSLELIHFGKWLWDNSNYEYAALCFHGVNLGLKIGVQLELTWDDLMNADGTARKEILIRDSKKNVAYHREASMFCRQFNEMSYRDRRVKRSEENVYIGRRSGKPIDTSNLSKTLQNYSEQYMSEKGIEGSDLVPLKSSCFEAAWCLDMVKSYGYSKKAFLEVARHIGKRTVGDLEKFILEKPKKGIIKMSYDHLDNCGLTLDFKEKRVEVNGRVRYEDFQIVKQ